MNLDRYLGILSKNRERNVEYSRKRRQLIKEGLWNPQGTTK